MNNFRYFTRRAWGIHLLVIFSLVFHPPQNWAVWRYLDTDNNGQSDYRYDDLNENEIQEEDEPGEFLDTDGDGLHEIHEVIFGTDVGNPDTDYDGITDGDEALTLGGAVAGFDPLSWDTDLDGYSDHDEFWSCYSVNYSSNPPSAFNWSYRDWDGDGIFNHQDSYPFDSTNSPPPPEDSDGDGFVGGSDSHEGNPSLWADWNNNGVNDTDEPTGSDSDNDSVLDADDSHPTNTYLWADWNNDGVNDDVDSDGDSHIDSSDSHAQDSSLWSDWNGNGINDDQQSDGDGVPDENDSHPQDGSLWSDWSGNGINDDQQSDGDGVPDEYDSHPLDDGLWSDWNGNSVNDDQNTDGDPVADDYDSHPEDSSLWDDWNGNGANDSAESADADGDNVPNGQDSHPDNSSLWSDWNGNGTNDDQNSDGDSVPDDYDSHPQDINLWSDWNGNGTNDDQNSDSDPYADDYDSHPLNSSLWSDWDNDGYNDGETPPPDRDGDGIPDDQDPYPDDPNNGDSDHDGLLDADEAGHNAVVGDSDTDDDGLSDGEEVAAGSLCDSVDTDGDGLTDYEEVMAYRNQGFSAISPTNKNSLHPVFEDYAMVELCDSDQDTIPDRIETFYGLNPDSAGDAFADMDGNGVTNAAQYAAGMALNADANLFDQDMDGMTDIFEVVYSFDPDFFGDAVLDSDGDGLLNFEEAAQHTSPWQPDSFLDESEVILPDNSTRNGSDFESRFGALDAAPAPFDVMAAVSTSDWDGDGMTDAWEHRFHFTSTELRSTANASLDADADGLTNLQEFTVDSDPRIADQNGNGVNDGADDWDDDGIPNAWEAAHGLNMNNAADASSDTDGDGISALDEFQFGLDPQMDDFNSKATINTYDVINRLTNTNTPGGGSTTYNYDLEGNLNP